MAKGLIALWVEVGGFMTGLQPLMMPFARLQVVGSFPCALQMNKQLSIVMLT